MRKGEVITAAIIQMLGSRARTNGSLTLGTNGMVIVAERMSPQDLSHKEVILKTGVRVQLPDMSSYLEGFVGEVVICVSEILSTRFYVYANNQLLNLFIETFVL